MFSEYRSELSIPVVGFLLLGFATLFAGIFVFNGEWNFLDAATDESQMLFRVIGGLLMVIAFFAFARTFLIEGTIFGIFGVFLFVFSFDLVGAITNYGVVAMMLCIVGAMLAFMAYRAGDLMITLMGVFSIVALLPVYFMADSEIAVAISGIGFIAVAVLALVYTVLEWMLVQDIAADMADYMYDDLEDCECGCGCESTEE